MYVERWDCNLNLFAGSIEEYLLIKKEKIAKDSTRQI